MLVVSRGVTITPILPNTLAPGMVVRRCGWANERYTCCACPVEGRLLGGVFLCLGISHGQMSGIRRPTVVVVVVVSVVAPQFPPFAGPRLEAAIVTSDGHRLLGVGRS